MKTFKFSINEKAIAYGYVEAEDIEEAKAKIANCEWDDIYDTCNIGYGELIDIQEE